jgi:hypothetical protein
MYFVLNDLGRTFNAINDGDIRDKVHSLAGSAVPAGPEADIVFTSRLSDASWRGPLAFVDEYQPQGEYHEEVGHRLGPP